MVCGPLQPVVGGVLHRRELEHPEPALQALPQGLGCFLGVLDVGIELGDVRSGFLLNLLLRGAGEGFAPPLSLLVHVPDHAAPAVVRPPEDIAVGQQLFLHTMLLNCLGTITGKR